MHIKPTTLHNPLREGSPAHSFTYLGVHSATISPSLLCFLCYAARSAPAHLSGRKWCSRPRYGRGPLLTRPGRQVQGSLTSAEGACCLWFYVAANSPCSCVCCHGGFECPLPFRPAQSLRQNLLATLLQCILKESSDLIDNSIRAAGFRGRFSAAVVAVKRDNKRVDGRIGDIIMQAGDQLVLDTGDCVCVSVCLCGFLHTSLSLYLSSSIYQLVLALFGGPSILQSMRRRFSFVSYKQVPASVRAQQT